MISSFHRQPKSSGHTLSCNGPCIGFLLEGKGEKKIQKYPLQQAKKTEPSMSLDAEVKIRGGRRREKNVKKK